MQEKSADPISSEPRLGRGGGVGRRRIVLGRCGRSSLHASPVGPGASLASPRSRSAVIAPMLGVAVTPRERRGQAVRRTNTREEVGEGRRCG